MCIKPKGGEKLSLGGRPREEGGHKGIHVSLDAEIYKGLEKIHDEGGNRSKLIENAVRPHIHQLDPGESCKVLALMDKTLNCEIVSALSKQDFEKATTLAAIGDSLTPFRCLCQISGDNNSCGSNGCTSKSQTKLKNISCQTIRSLLE